jgi:hypothetical protein
MNNQELQELSKKVAEKFGIDAYPYMGDWIHEDLKLVMRLAIKHFISITHVKDYQSGEYFCVIANESIADYDQHTSPEQAVIVAVMKALLEVKV